MIMYSTGRQTLGCGRTGAQMTRIDAKDVSGNKNMTMADETGISGTWS